MHGGFVRTDVGNTFHPSVFENATSFPYLRYAVNDDRALVTRALELKRTPRAKGGFRVATAPPTDTVVNVLWIPAGLSCDGDSVALTAAMQPSIEEIALGALPGLPGVKFHWPLIEYSLGGEEFLKAFFAAERGELDPFVLVIEGSIANESIKKEGYFTGFGNEPGTDQPITFAGWIDRLAPRAWAILAAGTCATYGGIHAKAGKPTGAMGIP